MEFFNLVKKFISKINKNHLKVGGGFLFAFIAIFLIIGFFEKKPTIYDKVFKIGADGKGAGFNFGEKEQAAEAFLADVLFKAAKGAKLKINLHVLASDEVAPQFDQDVLDGVVLFAGPKTWSEKNLLYSDTFYFLGPVLIVRENFDLADVKDTEKMRIGVRNGFRFFSQTGVSFVQFKIYDNMNVAIDDLMKGNVEGVVLDAFAAKLFLEGFYKGRLKVAFPLLTRQGIYLTMKETEEHKEFIKLFNASLEKMRKDGTYEALLEKWNVPDTSIYHP